MGRKVTKNNLLAIATSQKSIDLLILGSIHSLKPRKAVFLESTVKRESMVTSHHKEDGGGEKQSSDAVDERSTRSFNRNQHRQHQRQFQALTVTHTGNSVWICRGWREERERMKQKKNTSLPNIARSHMTQTLFQNWDPQAENRKVKQKTYLCYSNVDAYKNPQSIEEAMSSLRSGEWK